MLPGLLLLFRHGELLVALGEAGDQARNVRALIVQVRCRISQNVVGHAVSARNLQGMAFPGDAHEDAKRRSKALTVEPHGGVLRAAARCPVILEDSVVGRRDNKAAGLQEVVQERHREGHPLLGIRPGPQLVQQNERPPADGFDDAGDVPHVRGKSGQRLLDGLLVPDVGKHPVEDRERGAFRGRYLHAELVHQRKNANGLQAHGLSAGVWAR